MKVPKPPKMPKNLGLKMGTKERTIWEDMKQRTEANIEGLEKALIVDKAMLELCNQKIEEEKKKLDIDL